MLHETYHYSNDIDAGVILLDDGTVSTSTVVTQPLDEVVESVHMWIAEHVSDANGLMQNMVVELQDEVVLYKHCTLILWCAACSSLFLACMCTTFVCLQALKRPRPVTVVDATPLQIPDSKV